MAVYKGAVKLYRINKGATPVSTVNKGGVQVFPDPIFTVAIAPTSFAGFAGISTTTFTQTPSDPAAVSSYQWYVLRNAAYVPLGTETTQAYTATAGDTQMLARSFSKWGTSHPQNPLGYVDAVAPITVYDAVTCSITPTDLTGTEGTVIPMTCTAGGGSGIYTYQWFLSFPTVQIVGATLPTYDKTLVLAENGRGIFCQVSSAGQGANSNVAPMTVTPAGFVHVATFTGPPFYSDPAGSSQFDNCGIASFTPGSAFLTRGGALWWAGSGYRVANGFGDVTAYFNQGYCDTIIYPAGTWAGPTQPFFYDSDNVTYNNADAFGGGTWNAWNAGNVNLGVTVSSMNRLRMPFILMNLPHYEDFKDDLDDWTKWMISEIERTGEEIPGYPQHITDLVRPAMFLTNIGTKEEPLLLVTKGELTGLTMTPETAAAFMAEYGNDKELAAAEGIELPDVDINN